MTTCTTCGEPKPLHDLRPYGANGATVCFTCAMATPESRAEAERQFGAALEASGPVAFINPEDGLGVRPLPGSPTH